MKTTRISTFLLAFGVVTTAPLLHAQVELDPVTIPVKVIGEATADMNYVDVDFNKKAKLYVVLGSSTVAWNEAYTDFTCEGTAYLKPGRANDFWISETGTTDWRLHFHPPAGYSLHVENVERQKYPGSGDKFVRVRIEADSGLPAGEAPEPRPGRILWSASMGQLKSGTPAGAIQLRENDLTASTFTPSALYFDHENRT